MEKALLKVSPLENNENEKYNYKLSDEEFLAILKMNYCLYSDTAKAITQQYGIPYSRQAVQQRAARFSKEIKRYKAEISELAHRTVFEAIKQNQDMKLKYRASIYLLEKIDNQSRDNHNGSANGSPTK
jgi:hypothetical protein